MNMVIDASVAAKWLLSEPGTEDAERLYLACQEGKITPYAPEILPAEVASLLWKRFIRGFLEPERAVVLYARFNEIHPILAPVLGLAEAALKLALDWRHSVYDSLYVALALDINCGLVTADEKLYRAFAPSFPQVSLLRDWKP